MWMEFWYYFRAHIIVLRHIFKVFVCPLWFIPPALLLQEIKVLLILALPVTVAARSKAWVYGRSLAGNLGLNPSGACTCTCMSACFECCVLSVRGLCYELITYLEKYYRLWCIAVCDLETSRMRWPWPALGRSATGGGISLFTHRPISLPATKNLLSCLTTNPVQFSHTQRGWHTSKIVVSSL